MRHPSKRSFLALALSLLGSGAAFAAPPVTWSPEEVEIGIGHGIAEPVAVTFEARRPLRDLRVEVVPELAPFITVVDGEIASVEAGVERVVHLALYVPPETPEGVYEGVLRLRRGRRTIPRPLPIVVTVDYEGAMLSPDTRVLGREAAGRIIDVSPDGRELTFDGLDPELGAIGRGEVLAVPAGGLLPGGFLGRVVDLAPAGDGLRVVTEPAALSEAVLSAELEAAFELGEDLALVRAASRQPPAASGRLLEPVSVPLDAVLLDLDHDLGTTGDQVRAGGELRITPHLTLSLDIDGGRVEELSFGAAAAAHTRLVVEAEVAASFEREVELACVGFRPVVLWIGWLPVPVQPVLAVTTDVRAELGGAVRAGVEAGAELEAGLLFDGTDWSTVEDVSVELVPIGPTVSASAGLEGRAGPELSLLLYGAVGPQLRLSGLAHLSADPGRCPHRWELTGGVSLDGAVAMGPLSDRVADISFPDLLRHERLLAHAEPCEDAPRGGDRLAERILFASNRGGDHDIWMIPPQGGSPEVLVERAGDQLSPTVSPDGTRLAYLDRSGAAPRWTVRDLVGGGEEVVPGGGDHNRNFEWSADGTALVGAPGGCGRDVSRFPLAGGVSEVFSEPGRDTVWGVDWTTGRIVYSNDPCNSPFMEIKIFDPRTGTRTVLQGSDRRAVSQGNVTPDGQWLVYEKADRSFGAPRRIHVIPTTGGAEARISSRTGSDDRYLHLSPEGARVACSRRIDGRWGLWVVDRDGVGEEALLVDAFDNLQPDWAVVVVGGGE